MVSNFNPLFHSGRETCNIDYIINECARPVTPSQFSTADDEDVLKLEVTDNDVIRDMTQCLKDKTESPCDQTSTCEPCGADVLSRIGDSTFVTQEATVDMLMKCYNTKDVDEKMKCFNDIPYTARFVGRGRRPWAQPFHASSNQPL